MHSWAPSAVVITAEDITLTISVSDQNFMLIWNSPLIPYVLKYMCRRSGSIAEQRHDPAQYFIVIFSNIPWYINGRGHKREYKRLLVRPSC